MSVAYKDIGATATSNGSISMFVDPPATATAADLQLLHVTWKLTNDSTVATFNIPTVPGWTALWRGAGGTAAAGDNTGFVVELVYWRYGATPSQAEVPLLSVATNAGIAVQTCYTTSAPPWLDPHSGADSTLGANYSATPSNFDPRAISGDFFVVSVGLTSTAGSISADSVTNSSNETVRGTQTTSNGNNLLQRIITGTHSSDATAITYSHTNASSNAGTHVYIRIGEITTDPTPLFPVNNLVYDATRADQGAAGFTLYESAQSAGQNLAVMMVSSVGAGAIPTVPSGWTYLASILNDGVNKTRSTMWYRIGDSTEQFTNQDIGTFGANPVTIGGSATSSAGVIMKFATSQLWRTPRAGIDTDVNGAGITMTTEELGVVAGDVVLSVVAARGSTILAAGTTSISGMSMSSKHLTDLDIDPGTGANGAWDVVYNYNITGTEGGGLTYTGGTGMTSGALVAVRLSTRFTGTVTLTATAPEVAFSTYDSRYSVVASGIDTEEYTNFVLIRRSSDNNYDPQFVVSDGIVTDNVMTVNDYEFHFAPKNSLDPESHYYQMDLYAAGIKLGSVTSNTVTPHTDRTADPDYLGAKSAATWVKRLHTTEGNMAQPITINEFTGWSREARILGEYDILGSPYPVIITDVMKARTGSFKIVVYAEPDWLGGNSSIDSIVRLEEIFDSGETLYFQTTWPLLSGIHDFYFMVKGYSVQRVSNPVALHDPDEDKLPLFIVTIEYQEQERPAEEGNIAPVTWESLLTNYTTWANMSIANQSWLDVLEDA